MAGIGAILIQEYISTAVTEWMLEINELRSTSSYAKSDCVGPSARKLHMQKNCKCQTNVTPTVVGLHPISPNRAPRLFNLGESKNRVTPAGTNGPDLTAPRPQGGQLSVYVAVCAPNATRGRGRFK